MMLTREFRPGELVWFDPGVGYVLPGEVVEFHRAAQVSTAVSMSNTFALHFNPLKLSPLIDARRIGFCKRSDLYCIKCLRKCVSLPISLINVLGNYGASCHQQCNQNVYLK